jgi:hypothetical protein
MSFVAVSAGIGAASLGYGIYKDVSQTKQANDIAANNPRPTYQIPQEYRDNVAMAKQMAQIGLPQQQYNNQINGINQNNASAISALNGSANPGANLASILRGSNAAIGNLNAQDASARTANQKYAIGLNAQLGGQQLAKQQYDKFDKYTENFNQEQALKGAANQNLQNSVNGASQLAGSLYGLGQMNTFAMPTQSNTAQQMQIPQNYWNMPGLQGSHTQGGIGYNPPPLKTSPFNQDYYQYSPYFK